MDPVTVLQHAAETLGNAALTGLARQAVSEAWHSTAAVIRRRLGAMHPAPALIESLPAAACDKARTTAIADELAPMQIDKDPDVMAAIEKLSAVIEQQAKSMAHGIGSVNVGTITGIGVAVGPTTMTIHAGKGN